MALFSEIPGLDLRLCKSGIFTPLLRCRLSGVVQAQSKDTKQLHLSAQAKFLEPSTMGEFEEFLPLSLPVV